MNKYLVIGVVAILIIGGGWWYFSQSETPEVSNGTQVPTNQEQSADSLPDSNTPSASIDQNSLVSSNGTFSLMGSASNVSKIYVYTIPDAYSGKTDLQSLLDYVRGGATAFISADTITVSNGRWATSPNRAPYINGKYKVFVFDLSSNAITSGRDISPSCAPISCNQVRLLTAGTLIVGIQ